MAKTLTDATGATVILDTAVNVKVKGEKTMRKGVTLRDNGDGKSVRILTGKRGRPATIETAAIERVRAL
jgi:hypothetical protein